MFELLDVLSDPNRLRILHILGKSPCMVNELQEILDLSQANTSKHLKKMHDSNVVKKIKCKKNVCYYLNNDYLEACELFNPIMNRFEKEPLALSDYNKFKEIMSTDYVDYKKTMIVKYINE